MDSKQVKKPQANNRQVTLEKSQEREIWFKTVVKVLKWKEGKAKSAGVDLISDKEWAVYCKETLKINANGPKAKTQQKLKETEDLIKKHGGFAS